jgi:hypothetical protein
MFRSIILSLYTLLTTQTQLKQNYQKRTQEKLEFIEEGGVDDELRAKINKLRQE